VFVSLQQILGEESPENDLFIISGKPPKGQRKAGVRRREEQGGPKKSCLLRDYTPTKMPRFRSGAATGQSKSLQIGLVIKHGLQLRKFKQPRNTAFTAHTGRLIAPERSCYIARGIIHIDIPGLNGGRNA